jgi:hypothetical protein
MKTALRICVAACVIAAIVFGIARLRLHNSRLRSQVAELRRQVAGLAELRADQQRLNALTVHARSDDADSVRAVNADVDQARRELAELEQRALAGHARLHERAAAVEANRDPEKAPVRLEHFQNVGRGTPAHAFQTLVHAAARGDEALLIGTLAVVDATREAAEALLARLPAAARAKYPTPEHLAALAVIAELTRGNALQITGGAVVDSSTATVTIRSAGGAKDAPLPMRPGPGGWQFIVPVGAIKMIERQMLEATDPRK